MNRVWWYCCSRCWRNPWKLFRSKTWTSQMWSNGNCIGGRYEQSRENPKETAFSEHKSKKLLKFRVTMATSRKGCRWKFGGEASVATTRKLTKSDEIYGRGGVKHCVKLKSSNIAFKLDSGSKQTSNCGAFSVQKHKQPIIINVAKDFQSLLVKVVAEIHGSLAISSSTNLRESKMDELWLPSVPSVIVPDNGSQFTSADFHFAKSLE